MARLALPPSASLVPVEPARHRPLRSGARGGLRFGKPQNTDQGAQFTSEAFIGLLRGHNINISIDGPLVGQVFVERLWRM